MVPNGAPRLPRVIKSQQGSPSWPSRTTGDQSLTLKERIMGPAVPTKRPRRAAYALPTLFTSANIFLGFVAIMHAFEGATPARSRPLRFLRHRDWIRRFLRLAGRHGCAHDQYDQRLRARTRFPRRRHYVRYRARCPRLCLGRHECASAESDGLRASDRCRLFRRVFLPALRGCAFGALQRKHQPHAEKSRPAGSQVLRRHAHPRFGSLCRLSRVFLARCRFTIGSCRSSG